MLTLRICLSGQVTPCRSSSCCLGVKSFSRGLSPSAPWVTSSQRYATKLTPWHDLQRHISAVTNFFPPQARAGEYVSVLKGSVMSTLLDAGLLFLLRFALDDSVEGVMSAAVHALKALLVCAEDEVRQLCSTL